MRNGLSRAIPNKEKGAMPEDTRRGVNMGKVVHKITESKILPVGIKLTSEIVLFDAQLARYYRENYVFAKQRTDPRSKPAAPKTVKESRVAELTRELQKDRFVPGTQIFLCVDPDGKTYLVNGNNTLEAIARSDIPTLLTVTHLYNKTFDEACEIYACFDMHSKRSASDTMRAYDMSEYPLASKMYAAVNLIHTNFTAEHSGSHSRVDVVKGLMEYRHEAGFFDFATSGGAERKLLLRAGILAVALETYKGDPDYASDFWSSVAKDDGLAEGSPAKALLRYLRNSRAGGGKMVQIEHIKAAACAWNAYSRGEQIGFLRPNAMKSFYLLGTKWSGGVGGA